MPDTGVVKDGSATRLQILLAYAATYVFWGASFLAIRFAVQEIPPLFMMTVRCAAGALILFVFLRVRGSIQQPSRQQYATMFVAGVLCFLGCHGLLASAERHVGSGEAALYSSSTPLWIVLLDSARRRTAPSLREMSGILVGIVGVALLLGNDGTAAPLFDRALIVVGAFFWAAGSLVARAAAPFPSSAQSTAMQLTSGALALLVASVSAGELSSGWSPWHVHAQSLFALAFLIICATVLAFGAYTWLLRAVSPAAASTYAFANPLIALALGALLDNGELTLRIGFAAAFIVAAIGLTRSTKPAATVARPLTATAVRASSDRSA